jgi:hypothetical protein
MEGGGGRGGGGGLWGGQNVDISNRFYRPGLKRYSGHSLEAPLCYFIFVCADDCTVVVGVI